MPPTSTLKPTVSPTLPTSTSKPTASKPVFNDKVNVDAVKAIVEKDKSAPAINFTDVPATSWSASVVERAAKMGIVTGYSDGSFHPNQEIYCAEIVAMLARLTNYVPNASNLFLDVATNWASEQINAFATAGIVTGKGNELFKPKDAASRAESVAMIIRLWDKLLTQ
ncbi:MAG TPA: hypothetical protein DEA91_19525 [Paenibacillus sp.]|nr:hypothetical protein [Paenibacillus sp.]